MPGRRARAVEVLVLEHAGPAGLRPRVSGLLMAAGRTAAAAQLAEGGAVLRELARVEHEAMEVRRTGWCRGSACLASRRGEPRLPRH
ncbi:hypothetical protein [Streptomyces sp. NPDC019224]|uniref:hypothetical protein n=1 Tax=Streptomyces sp. NPDC019224 TaxID=3154484 RepID=UPI0033D6DDAA